MNRAERRRFERSQQRRASQIRQDMQTARDRDGRYRYMIFLNNVPAWPDSLDTEKQAKAVLQKITGAMRADDPTDARLDQFEIRPVLPSTT